MGVHARSKVQVKPLRVVSIYDTAIVEGRSNLLLYAETRDMTHLVLSEHEEPFENAAFFSIRPVDHSVLDWIRSSCGKTSGERACVELFRYGCVGFENLWYLPIRYGPGGLQEVAEKPERVQFAAEVEEGMPSRMADSAFLKVHETLRLELGTIVLRMSIHSLGLAGKSSPREGGANSRKPGTTVPGAENGQSSSSPSVVESGPALNLSGTELAGGE